MINDDGITSLKTTCCILAQSYDQTASTSALISQSRILSAMFTLVTTCALDEEYGSREEYTRTADRLFDTIRQRLGNEPDPAIAAELILAMFRLATECRYIADSEKTGHCIELAENCLATVNFRAMTNIYLQVSCCKLMLYNLYSCYQHDDDPSDYLHVKAELDRTIGGWLSAAGDQGWPDITPVAALLRIQVMNTYTCMLADNRYKESADRLFIGYRASADQLQTRKTLTDDDVMTLAVFYETIADGSPTDRKPMRLIADRLRHYGQTHPQLQNDLWHRCQDITVHNAANGIRNNYLHEIIG